MPTALSNLSCLIARNALADVCIIVLNALNSDPQIYRAIRIVFSAVSTPS